MWDFPRPPRIEAVPLRLRVEFGGGVIADTTAALRVCETSSPPAYYVPPADIAPGSLEPSERTAAWLWDHHVAAVAADNLALEAMPLSFEEGKFLHFWLIPCFGMPIGELWWLDDLARACAGDGRWVFQLVSAPLNVRGGVGSPPNAIAIR